MAKKAQTDVEMTEAQENSLIEYTPRNKDKEDKANYESQGARPKEPSGRPRRESRSSSEDRSSSRSSHTSKRQHRRKKTSRSTRPSHSSRSSRHRSPETTPQQPAFRPPPPLQTLAPPLIQPPRPLPSATAAARPETREYLRNIL